MRTAQPVLRAAAAGVSGERPPSWEGARGLWRGKQSRGGRLKRSQPDDDERGSESNQRNGLKCRFSIVPMRCSNR